MSQSGSSSAPTEELPTHQMSVKELLTLICVDDNLTACAGGGPGDLSSLHFRR